jgi:hypothetical protein
MSTPAAKLFITGEGTQLQRELAKAQKTTEKAFSGMAKAAKGVALAFGAAFGARALVGFFNQTIQRADDMLKLTQRIGGTTEALSELEFVAQRSGLQFTTMTMGLQRMTRRLAEAANGMGEARGALAELNLDARTLSRLPLDQQFEVIADALNSVRNESDRVRLAMKLFDAEGVALLQTMTQGAAGIKALREEARKLGITLSQDDAEAAARFNDELTSLKALATSVGRDIALELIPPLLDLAQLFRDIDPATQSTAALRAELQQLRDLLADPNVFKRIGVFKLGGEREFFLSSADLHAEINRIEAELEVRSLAAGEKGGESLAAGFATGSAKLREDMAAFGFTATRIFEDLPSPTIKLGVLADENALRAQLAEFGFTAQRMFEELPSPTIKLGVLTDQLDDMQRSFESFGSSLGRSLEDALADAFLGIETDFDEMLRRMVVQAATSQLSTALGAVGGPVGTVFSFLGFGGARAGGGDVQPGRAFLVGERGPELFSPRTPGTIVPNGGMRPGNLNVNVDARGATDPAEVERAVNRAVVTAVQISRADTLSMFRNAQRPTIA